MGRIKEIQYALFKYKNWHDLWDTKKQLLLVTIFLLPFHNIFLPK